MNTTYDFIEETTKKLSTDLYNSAGTLPSKEKILLAVSTVRRIIFPAFFDADPSAVTDPRRAMHEVYTAMREQIRIALIHDGAKDADKAAEAAARTFIERLPDIQALLVKDVEAEFVGDPAAKSKEEIIFSYPGIYAIFSYRIAHELHTLGIPFIPRMITENAHSLTGIDIHPAAKIGEYFFIDHGTGVVIGETCVIGNNVKIYQCVTLGALSLKEGRKLSEKKRHPTIEDGVTIYANSTILGGDTVIGRGCVIGGNAFITESVAAGTKVIAKANKLEYK